MNRYFYIGTISFRTDSALVIDALKIPCNCQGLADMLGDWADANGHDWIDTKYYDGVISQELGVVEIEEGAE
jgi:hypothetical protein